MVATMEVAPENVSSYGILDVDAATGTLMPVRGMVEKPKREVAPSNMAVIGRYILTPQVLRNLEDVEAGAGGEIQLTDAIAAEIATPQGRAAPSASRAAASTAAPSPATCRPPSPSAWRAPSCATSSSTSCAPSPLSRPPFPRSSPRAADGSATGEATSLAGPARRRSGRGRLSPGLVERHLARSRRCSPRYTRAASIASAKLLSWSRRGRSSRRAHGRIVPPLDHAERREIGPARDAGRIGVGRTRRVAGATPAASVAISAVPLHAAVPCARAAFPALRKLVFECIPRAV